MFQLLSRAGDGLSDEEAFERTRADLIAAVPDAVADVVGDTGVSAEARDAAAEAVRGRLEDLSWSG